MRKISAAVPCVAALSLLSTACARSVVPAYDDGSQPDAASDSDAGGGHGRLVYQNDFEDRHDPLSEWSPHQTDVTPAGSRRFLGPYPRGTVAFELDDWAPHVAMSITFDLFVMGSWDGSQVMEPTNVYTVGPDLWDLVADGNISLVHTTFSNIDDYGAMHLRYPQAWPESHPQGHNPPHTSAVAVNSLGFPGSDTGLDATYHVAVHFAHSGPSLRLTITTNDPQTPFVDETWGIDNIVIRAEQ